MLIFWAVLALSLITLLFIIRPDISLYVLSFCLPFIGWNLNIDSLKIPLADFVALMVLFSFFLKQTYLFLLNKKKSPIKWPLLIPFSIFLIISLLSSLFSSVIIYSLWYWVRWPLFMYFAYILVPYNLIKDRENLKKTIITLILSSLLVLINGYLSLYGQDWHNSFFRIRPISWGGVYFFGNNHNLIAEFLNVGVFLILSLKTIIKNETLKRYLNIIFIFAILGLILTFSRTAWIILILQSLIYVFYRFHSQHKKFTELFLTAFIILAVISPLFWKMEQLQQSNTSSTQSRWLLTKISIQAFYNKPYLGYGNGEFIHLVADNIRFHAKYGKAIDSHGMIQKILAENGIFALAGWLFIIIVLIKESVRALKKYYRRNPWLLGLFLAGGGGLFFQFLNTSYYKGKVWLPIAVSLAAINLLDNKYGQKKKESN